MKQNWKKTWTKYSHIFKVWTIKQINTKKRGCGHLKSSWFFLRAYVCVFILFFFQRHFFYCLPSETQNLCHTLLLISFNLLTHPIDIVYMLNFVCFLLSRLQEHTENIFLANRCIIIRLWTGEVKQIPLWRSKKLLEN